MAYINGNKDFVVMLKRGGDNTGYIYDGTPIEVYPDVEESTDTDFVFTGETDPTYIEDIVKAKVKKDEFGDAKPSDVRSGKTFTSADGVKIAGTNTGDGGGADISTGSVYVSLSSIYNACVEMWYTVLEDGKAVRKYREGLPGEYCSLLKVITGSLIVLRCPSYINYGGDMKDEKLLTYVEEQTNGGMVLYCFEVVAAPGKHHDISFWE